MLSENVENSISKLLNYFKIFWGGMLREPSRKLVPSALKKKAATYIPSGDIYFKTYWQHWLISRIEYIIRTLGKLVQENRFPNAS